ncbi:MAG: YafY family protein [Chloroflexota bacterium]
MNRTDRLLAIVLELQGKGKQRAEDLAATFETSKRTIYRDIQALAEAGVPIVSVPGLGYSLVEGYFLPPLRFTTDEGAMLMLGSDLMAQHFDAEYRAAAQSAGRKIAGALSEPLRDEVQYLRDSIRFIALGAQDKPDEVERLQQLRRSIVKRQTVRFRYFAKHSDENSPNTRDADPYGLVHVSGSWILVAYCHLRHDMRNFRLSRMEHLTLLPKTFARQPNFSMQEYLRLQRDLPSEEWISVCVLFDQSVVRLVEEGYLFFVVAKEETAEGLRLTLRVREERDVVQWLLSWGKHVRVIEPASLRDFLIEETTAMLHNLQNEAQHHKSPIANRT